MATHIESDSEASVGTLVGGIVQDARKLLVEQMTLFQVEVKNDVRRTIQAAIPLVVGVCTAMAGLILLGMAGSHLLCWFIPEIPLWAAYAIGGGIIAATGLIFIACGTAMFETVSPTPDATIKGLKENLQWKTKT